MRTPPLAALITICRPANALMAASACALGAAFGRAEWAHACALAGAAACATAFGNVVNDLRDIDTDRIAHPDRPLVAGRLSVRTARILAAVLAMAATTLALAVSSLHAAAAVVPLALLYLYAHRLKATVLAGNAVVAALVAYPVLFGALGTPALHKLWIPALLAMLTNFVRELVKTLQDKPGDTAAGLTTTARLPLRAVHGLAIAASGAALALLYVPFLLGHFTALYALVCTVVVVPLTFWRASLMLSDNWQSQLGRISTLVKLELLAGLAAMASGWRW